MLWVSFSPSFKHRLMGENKWTLIKGVHDNALFLSYICVCVCIHIYNIYIAHVCVNFLLIGRGKEYDLFHRVENGFYSRSHCLVVAE